MNKLNKAKEAIKGEGAFSSQPELIVRSPDGKKIENVSELNPDPKSKWVTGWTGEEMWDTMVGWLKDQVSEKEFQWLNRVQYISRDAWEQTITIRLPKRLKSTDKLMGLLCSAVREHGFAIKEIRMQFPYGASDSTADTDWAEQWKVRSGKNAILGTDDEPRWVIQDLLAEKSGLLLSGLPHSTKSLCMLAAALDCVTTKKVWGHFAVPETVKNVVFVETEDPLPLVQRRLRHLCKGKKLSYPPPEFHLLRTGPFKLVEEGEENLREVIRRTNADILFLSTLQGLLNGADWKEQKDMGPVNASAVRLQRECALVMITHSPWTEKRAAGSVTQSANFSSLMHFEKRIADGQTTITVTADTKETGESPQFYLQLETAHTGKETTQVRGVRYTGAKEVGRPTAEVDLARAAELKREGKTLAEIAEELNISPSTLKRKFKEVKSSKYGT